MHTYLCYFRL